MDTCRVRWARTPVSYLARRRLVVRESVGPAEEVVPFGVLAVCGKPSPHVAVAPVTRELAVEIQLHREGEHEHRAVVVGRTHDAVGRE